jgi:ABC-2 type transport system permease protein
MAELFPDQAARDAFAAQVALIPTQLALLGPVYDTSVAGLTAWRVSAFSLFVGMFALFSVTRHGRALEQQGQMELVVSRQVGRLWPMRLAVLWSMVLVVLLGTMFGLVMIGQGVPVADSLLLGWSFSMDGLVMAAIAAVISQVWAQSRTANLVAGAVMTGGFFLNAIGRINDSWLVWFSPIAWVQRTQPIANNQWWVLGVGLTIIVVLLICAELLLRGRAYGAGYLNGTSDMPIKSTPSIGPIAFWWRLHRGQYLSWLVASAVLALLITGLASSIETQFATSPQLVSLITMIGGSDQLMLAYMGFMLVVVAMLASAAAIMAIQQVRQLEHQQLLELWLAGQWSRTRLFGLVVAGAFIQGTSVLAVYALIAGLLAPSSLYQVGDVLMTALLYLPAVALTVALAVFIWGYMPQFLGMMWLWLAVNGAVAFLNDVWRLDTSVVQFLPLAHTPLYLVDLTVTTYPLVVSVVTVVVLGMAYWSWMRRDVGR